MTAPTDRPTTATAAAMYLKFSFIGQVDRFPGTEFNFRDGNRPAMTSKRPTTRGAAQMNETIGVYFGVAMTPWKAIGLSGALLFAARWLVQALATRRAARPTIPRSFWVVSLSGSAMVTAYFIWGKNDAVGVLTNLLPASVAVYNLVMDIRSARKRAPSVA
jgi:lipid-A-disaccharide synthase-like uncharacterized protein